MKKNSAPIGVFDSGLGGASVLREALRLLPKENYLYYGDNGNAPYGDRPENEITALSLRCVHQLLDMGCKAILVACNTATANCIDIIRTELNVPVVSVEPAIRPACSQPGTGKVLMMATLATTRFERYLALQQRMPDPSRIINIPCPGIVDRIERGLFADADFDDLFDEHLRPYEGLDTDGIVLGCTHYVFIPGAFRRAAARHLHGPCTLYDGNEGTAHQLARVLEEHGLENTEGSALVEFHTSGDPILYKSLFDQLLSR
ncbi:MAG: glutamate racemase [Clostridia bacterium]|nr:glutamate racemase [Candidatus Pelethousia sp.]NCB30364.1 glutamate racemase [Clostridia bacterium]